LNVEVEFVHTTWGTLMDDLLADKFDVGMSGISINLARQRLAMFSNRLMSGGKAAISRDEDAEKFKTTAAINQPNVRVIVNPGGTNELFTRENFPKAQLILNEDNITVFQKIADGEADIMVTDAIETIIQEQVHPELEAVNPNAPFNYTEKGYLFQRDSVFKAYIDQWLNLRLKDGTVQKLKSEQIANYVNLKN
ncbi:MAG: transporter substrate-binding domain-containing protein, partial [Emcibacteraceae bacterium]|nr:transporter substrate-binding domain-containing protein [Emcibacteraceae bacterium]